MSDICYKPLIDDMVWSFSRIEAYDDCPYRWYLKYIKQHGETEKFYASYGSFMHRLIEQYYTGEIEKDDMMLSFLKGFSSEVKGARPKEETVKKYIQSGTDYLKNFKPFPFNVIGVEEKIEFDIDGIPFVCWIDYIGERNGNYYIVDNKSRALKERSGKTPPTSKDNELDDMLKQLYLYSAAVREKYGRFPSALCFNCFRTGVFITEPFDVSAYERTKAWAISKIDEIKNSNLFYPKQDYFACYNICGVSDHCRYDIEAKERRRRR